MQKTPDTGCQSWKLPAFVLLAVAAIGMAWFILTNAETEPEEKSARIKAAADQLDQSANAADDAVDLAIKTLSLSQGEGGFELWRLKAEWANLRKRDDLIIVEEPRLTYNMREEGKVLFVESRIGDINQKRQILRFVEHVRVTQDDKRITGPLLVYDGGDKTMTFPQGCDFIDTGVNGSMDTLVWHINRQLIEGDGNVKVLLEGSAKSFPAITPDSHMPGEPASAEDTP